MFFPFCPTVLWCDYGTENVNTATIQVALRILHDDAMAGEKSIMCGPSTSNIASDILYTGKCTWHWTIFRESNPGGYNYANLKHTGG